jgi:hypothetical protein
MASFGAIEAAEDGAIDAEGLLPARRAFAHGVAQIAPHAKQRFIGVAHVPAERVGTAAVQIMFGHGLIAVDPFSLASSPECGAAIEQAFERAGVEFQFLGEFRRGSRTLVERSKMPSASAVNMVLEWRKASIRSRTGLGSGTGTLTPASQNKSVEPSGT